MRLFIATPMYGGMCAGVYTNSLMKLQQQLMDRRITFGYMFRYNESLITRARNALVHHFLYATEFTHLLFIDSDIGFDPDEVLKMVDADKDIICGIYPTKTINWNAVHYAVKKGVPAGQLEDYQANWVINFVKYGNGDQKVELSKPFEIYNGGTGMMLIKRRVFDKLKPKTKHYTMNENDHMMASIKEKKVGDYFSLSIDKEANNVLLSEDYHFCKSWRKIGGKVWAAPWVNLSHVGTYEFKGKPEPI